MVIKVQKVLVFAAVIVSGVFLSAVPLGAQESSSTQIKAKLEKILQNQKEITAKLDQIKAELQIVKIRATNR